MSRDDLIQSIEDAIGILQSAYRDDADESDLYEASLLALCVDAARSAGGNVMLTFDGRNPASRLCFRRSPGNLWAGRFTYGLVSFPGVQKQLEIHLGVYVTSGRSRVPHECDVAILDRQESERSRQAAVHPRSRALVTVIEAKHYSTSPSLGVGRSFLGLAQELGQKNCSLVFPSQSSVNLAGLIARLASEAYEDLLPGREAAARLRSRIDQSIRNWRARI